MAADFLPGTFTTAIADPDEVELAALEDDAVLAIELNPEEAELAGLEDDAFLTTGLADFLTAGLGVFLVAGLADFFTTGLGVSRMIELVDCFTAGLDVLTTPPATAPAP